MSKLHDVLLAHKHGHRSFDVEIDGVHVTHSGLTIEAPLNDVPRLSLNVPMGESVLKGSVEVVFVAAVEAHPDGRMDVIRATGPSRAEALRNLAAKVEDWEFQFGKPRPMPEHDPA